MVHVQVLFSCCIHQPFLRQLHRLPFLRSAGRHGWLHPLHYSDPVPFQIYRMHRYEVRLSCWIYGCWFHRSMQLQITWSVHCQWSWNFRHPWFRQYLPLFRHHRSSEQNHPFLFPDHPVLRIFLLYGHCGRWSDDLRWYPDHKHALAVRILPLHSLWYQQGCWSDGFLRKKVFSASISVKVRSWYFLRLLHSNVGKGLYFLLLLWCNHWHLHHFRLMLQPVAWILCGM